MKEYFDVLTEEGEKTGKQKLRSEVHRDGDWHAVVHAWVINDAKEILVQKRSMKKDTYPGKWDISCAGHIEAGEEVLPTAVREFEEELGVKVTESEMIPLDVIKQSKETDKIKDNEVQNVFVLRKSILINDLTLQSEEVDEAEYLSVDEFEKRVQEGVMADHPEEYVLVADYVRKLDR
jgi:isopentenyldiphosphate isomerase